MCKITDKASTAVYGFQLEQLFGNQMGIPILKKQTILNFAHTLLYAELRF